MTHRSFKSVWLIFMCLGSFCSLSCYWCLILFCYFCQLYNFLHCQVLLHWGLVCYINNFICLILIRQLTEFNSELLSSFQSFLPPFLPAFLPSFYTGLELRALCLLGRYSTTWATLLANSQFFCLHFPDCLLK
jgi:hypothetical protein